MSLLKTYIEALVGHRCHLLEEEKNWWGRKPSNRMWEKKGQTNKQWCSIASFGDADTDWGFWGLFKNVHYLHYTSDLQYRNSGLGQKSWLTSIIFAHGK